MHSTLLKRSYNLFHNLYCITKVRNEHVTLLHEYVFHMSDILLRHSLYCNPFNKSILVQCTATHVIPCPPSPTFSPEAAEQQRKNVQTNMRYDVPQIHQCKVNAGVDS